MKAIGRTLMTGSLCGLSNILISILIMQQGSFARVRAGMASVEGQRTAAAACIVGAYKLFKQLYRQHPLGQAKWPEGDGNSSTRLPASQPASQPVSHVTGSRSLFRTFVAAAEISQQEAAANMRHVQHRKSRVWAIQCAITIMPQQR